MILHARQHSFEFPRPALVMGVLNVTPDSFSDGGLYLNLERAVARGVELVDQGAELLDVGGESSRPGAAPVSEAEELRRVVPVVRQLSDRIKVPISVDTMKPAVAEAALEAGASIVNDVAANREDPTMWQVVSRAQAGYVCMHMQGSPETMQLEPTYANVVDAVETFFRDRLTRLEQCGVSAAQVIFDVGIGFGKTLEHNLQLLAALRSLKTLERPMMLGVSRKSFIGKLLGAGAAERLPASLACASLAVSAGVQIIRTHDVRETVQAVRMTEAIQKYDKQRCGR